MGPFDFLKNKATQPDSSKTKQVADFSVGDIFYTMTDGKYNLYKLLVYGNLNSTSIKSFE